MVSSTLGLIITAAPLIQSTCSSDRVMDLTVVQDRSKRVSNPSSSPWVSSLIRVGKRNASGQSLPSAPSKLHPAIPTLGLASKKRTSEPMAPGRACVSGFNKKTYDGVPDA